MRIKIKALFVIFVATLFLSGCVMKTTYDAKVQENQILSQDLDKTKGSLTELQDQNDKLVESNTQQGKELNEVKGKLEDALKPENLLKTLAAFIAEQQAKIDALIKENASLKVAVPAPAIEIKTAEPAVDAVPSVVTPAATEPAPVAVVVADTPVVEVNSQEPVAEAAPVVENVPVEPAVEVPASETVVAPETKTVPAN